MAMLKGRPCQSASSGSPPCGSWLRSESSSLLRGAAGVRACRELLPAAPAGAGVGCVATEFGPLSAPQAKLAVSCETDSSGIS